MNYDLIIVGAGLAGLTVGLESLKKNPDLKVIILEKYDYVGGRVYTHHQGKLSWEAGAGRIGDAQISIHGLVKRYGLSTYPIGPSDGSTYIRDGVAGPNSFTDLLATYVLPLAALPSSVQESHTLADLLEKIHGHAAAYTFWNMFPYWAEIHTLRADLAIHSFMTEFGKDAEYSVIKGGFSQIPEGLATDFKRLGGKIQFKTTVQSIHRDGKDLVIESIKGQACVLALPSVALKHIDYPGTIPALPHLVMKPLVRMYAVFKKKEWLQDLTKIVCDKQIRYIIPVSAEAGIIMISYTDGADAAYWIEYNKVHGLKGVQKAIMKEIRQLLPDKDIGEPITFTIHPWSNGCSYWLPGHYSPEAMIRNSMCFAPGLFVCGESFSMRQAWVEGALESAEQLLGTAEFQKQIKREE